MTALLFIKEFWPHILGGVVVVAFVSFALWVGGLVDEVQELERANAELARQCETYRANEVTAEMLRLQVDECLEDIQAAQAEGEAWQARYDALKAQAPQVRTIEVPVEVSAPGTPCDEAVAQIAGWLEEVIPHED